MAHGKATVSGSVLLQIYSVTALLVYLKHLVELQLQYAGMMWFQLSTTNIFLTRCVAVPDLATLNFLFLIQTLISFIFQKNGMLNLKHPHTFARIAPLPEKSGR